MSLLNRIHRGVKGRDWSISISRSNQSRTRDSTEVDEVDTLMQLSEDHNCRSSEGYVPTALLVRATLAELARIVNLATEGQCTA